jgi:glucose/arabinose dehydrogenase
MKHIILILSSLVLSLPTLASKARQKALQLDVVKTPVDRIRFQPGFELVDQKEPELPLQKLKLPPGYRIAIFAVVPGARSLALGEDGVVFVGSRKDRVYRLQDPHLKGRAETVEILLKDLNNPNGVAYKDGALYVAEIQQILRIQNIAQASAKSIKPEVLPQKFPSDAHHGWKFIRFGPDGWLYVPVGANCNVCDPGTEYGRLYRINVNGQEKEIMAEGIRNTVGFDWNPVTKELWFTDNGRDLLGEDTPPDELNLLSKRGENFGFPFCYGKSVRDPEFKKPCSQFVPAQVELPAHVAAIGMRFWEGNIILAEHGSWNRSQPQGYNLTMVKMENGKAVKASPWVEGWLQGSNAWGRPVDVQVYFDGSLLVSDDEAGVVYRISKK